LVIVTLSELSALAQVVVVDLVLAGDNAIVVGLVAAGLPRHQRAKVIFIGIVAATVLRVCFAVVTTQLLQIIGLTLAGGLLLLWVTWKLWREIRAPRMPKAQAAPGREGAAAAHADDPIGPPNPAPGGDPDRAGRYLHVPGQRACRGRHLAGAHLGAGLRPRSLGRPHGPGRGPHRRPAEALPWVSYIGLAIIFYVAVKMIYSAPST
jgi:hypothetical protein